MFTDLQGLPASSFIGLQSGWTLNNGILTVPKNTRLTPGSYLRIYYTTYPGDEIEISYEYKVLSGDFGLAYLEGHADNSYNNQVYSHGIKNEKTEWSSVKEKFIVPLVQGVKYSRLSIGVGYNEGATVQYRNIKINVNRASSGKIPNFSAVGVIRKQSNDTCVINQTSMNTGIISTAYEDEYTVSVILEDAYSDSLISHPFIFVMGSVDEPLIPVIGNYTRNNDGTIKALIKWSAGNSFADISGKTLFVTILAFR